MALKILKWKIILLGEECYKQQYNVRKTRRILYKMDKGVSFGRVDKENGYEAR